jgi:hypothetical protein
MGKHRIKPNYRRRVLRLPDLDHCKLAVFNSLGSPASRRVYEYAIDQFIAWYCSEPRLAFNRIVVVRYRMHLEARGLAANTMKTVGFLVLGGPCLLGGCGGSRGGSIGGSPNATLSATVLAFGGEAVGTTSPAQSITLSNYGTATLTGVSLAATADFAQTNTCGSRQGWTHSHGTDSVMGEGRARSVDCGSRGHGGKDLSSRRQDGKGMGERHLAECRVVRSQDLLRESGLGAHRTA